MKMSLYVCAALALCFTSTARAAREIALNPMGDNRVLLVGVPHGLPGIDQDLNSVQAISAHPSYNFAPTKLWSADGTVSRVAKQLTELTSKIDERGTFFFYFSGHGSRGSINLQDRSMKIGEIRQALEQGRASAGPLARLVMVFDSCFSGSLLDPLRAVLGPIEAHAETDAFVAELAKELTAANRAESYWKSLFVFASSRANETSNAGSGGSEFTVAFKKAFDETVSAGGTMGDLVSKSKSYTHGHHPVERFTPADIANEKLVP